MKLCDRCGQQVTAFTTCTDDQCPYGDLLQPPVERPRYHSVDTRSARKTAAQAELPANLSEPQASAEVLRSDDQVQDSCPSCDWQVRPGSLFCGGCGANLTGGSIAIAKEADDDMEDRGQVLLEPLPAVHVEDEQEIAALEEPSLLDHPLSDEPRPIMVEENAVQQPVLSIQNEEVASDDPAVVPVSGDWATSQPEVEPPNGEIRRATDGPFETLAEPEGTAVFDDSGSLSEPEPDVVNEGSAQADASDGRTSGFALRPPVLALLVAVPLLAAGAFWMAQQWSGDQRAPDQPESAGQVVADQGPLLLGVYRGHFNDQDIALTINGQEPTGLLKATGVARYDNVVTGGACVAAFTVAPDSAAAGADAKSLTFMQRPVPGEPECGADIPVRIDTSGGALDGNQVVDSLEVEWLDPDTGSVLMRGRLEKG